MADRDCSTIALGHLEREDPRDRAIEFDWLREHGAVRLGSHGERPIRLAREEGDRKLGLDRTELLGDVGPEAVAELEVEQGARERGRVDRRSGTDGVALDDLAALRAEAAHDRETRYGRVVADEDAGAGHPGKGSSKAQHPSAPFWCARAA